VDVIVASVQSKSVRKGDEVQVCILILDMFHMLPASSFKLFEPLLTLCVKAEKALGTELSSLFREPLLKFALRFSSSTTEFFLANLSEMTVNRIFHYFLQHKDGIPLKEFLSSNPEKLISSTFTCQLPPIQGSDENQKKIELQYQGIAICQ
jgi:transformation/transcription domain-associated protein